MTSTADQLSTKQKKQATELPHESFVNFGLIHCYTLNSNNENE